jgi:hypothetical protein
VLESKKRLGVIVPLFLFANFTTYEFVGQKTAAYFEAFCSMMFAHLALIGLGFIVLRDRLKGSPGRANRPL